MNRALRPAQGQTLTENVISQMLDLIRNGSWKPGQSLPSERALIQDLGVSRPCLREALQSLAALGVIEVRAGRPARVKALSLHSVFDPAGMAGTLASQDIEHLWEVRVALEAAAVRLVADRLMPGGLSRLDEVLSAMAQCAEKSDVAGYAEADLAFHRCILDLTGNPVFSQVYEVICRMIRLSVRATGAIPGGMHRGIQGHGAILEAVRGRDPVAAEAAARAHLDSAREWALATNGMAVRPGEQTPSVQGMQYGVHRRLTVR